MITAVQSHPFPLRCFTRMRGAGRERTGQSQSLSLLLSTLRECLTALAAVALLAAEAWGVSSAVATRGACVSLRAPCESSSTVALRCVELPTSLLPVGERLAYTLQAYGHRRVSGGAAPAHSPINACLEAPVEKAQ